MAITPNMNLDLPEVGVTPGPQYATLNNGAFNTIDTHDHTSGKGVKVPTAGLNIDGDLDFNDNGVIGLKQVTFISQATNPSTNQSFFVDTSNDLFYRNSSGDLIRLTTGSNAGPFTDANIASGANIAQSKLNLSITDSEVNPSAGIQASKISGTAVTRNANETITGLKTFNLETIHNQIATPGAPSAGTNKLYFKSDNSLYKQDSAGNEIEVGAGTGVGFGEINYIENATFETDTTGWATYADAAGSTPVDGTGGSPNITISSQNTVVLRDSRSLQIAKDAANRQGEGASYDFTIKEQDISKKLKIQFDFKTNEDAAYTNGDLTVYIYDVTNATLITPVDVSIIRGQNIFQTSFNSTTSLNYRLIFHIATTNAAAWNVQIDNVIVGPGMTSQGAAIGPWTTYTPAGLTGGEWGNSTNINVQYRRVGDSIELRGEFEIGTSTSAEAQLDLPAGLTIGGINAGAAVVGDWASSQVFSSAAVIYYLLSTPGDTFLNISRQLSTTNTSSLDPIGADNFGTSGTRQTFTTSLIPIQQFQGSGIVPMLSEDNLSEWQDITGGLTWSGNTPARTDEQYKYRRIGDELQIHGSVGFTANGSAGTFYFELPFGYTFDNDKIGGSPTSSRFYEIGYGGKSDSSAAQFRSFGLARNDTTNQVAFARSTGDTAGFLAGTGLDNGDVLNFFVRVPIVDYDGSQNSLVGYTEASSNNLGLVKKPDSEIRLDTGNGHGSTNNTIRRFLNTTSSAGSSMTLNQSASDGDSITINEAGVYSITYTDRVTSSTGQHGISKNASVLSGVSGRINNLPASERGISTFTLTTANNCSVPLILAQNDIIRAQTDGFGNESTGAEVQFVITQLFKL